MAAHGEEIPFTHLRDFVAQYRDAAGVWMQQAERELQNRALARSGHSEESLGLAERELERDPAQYDIVFEREMHIFKCDHIAGGPRRAIGRDDGRVWRHRASCTRWRPSVCSKKDLQQPRHKNVSYDNQDHGCHYGLCSSSTDALRTYSGG